MKTKIVGLTVAFLLAVYSMAGIACAGYDSIAECSAVTSTLPSVTVGETFVPGVNRIATISVRIIGTGATTQSVDLRDASNVYLGGQAITTDQADWFTVAFETPIAVNPTATYKVTFNNASPDWQIAYSEDADCYSGGAADFGGIFRDINFRVTGFNYVAPTPTPTPVATPTPTPAPTATPTPTPAPTITPDTSANNSLTAASFDDANDIQLLASGTESSSKKPLSNLTKILIGAGALVVVAGGIFAYLKFFKNKKK